MKPVGAVKLNIQPISFDEAKAFVAQYHRPPVGHKFSIAVNDGIKVVGVAIVGRPTGRHSDNGWTLEVTRLCTDGTKNAASMLYAAAWRAASAMGYRRLITYILAIEPGISVKAAGWKEIGTRGGGSWSCPSRPRVDKHPLGMKTLFKIRTDDHGDMPRRKE